MRVELDHMRYAAAAASEMRQKYARDGVIVAEHEPTYWLWNYAAAKTSSVMREAFGAPFRETVEVADVELDEGLRQALAAAIMAVYGAYEDADMRASAIEAANAIQP